MTNTYVASVEGVGKIEGASQLVDVVDLCKDMFANHDALASVFDAGGFALDVLGDIGDPLGAVVSCAVGWVVEHVAFLREPVDWLAGDPHSIAAATQTWANVGGGMREAAQRYATELSSLSAQAWSGEAADAYRRRGAQWVDVLEQSASAAEVQSVLIAATGGLCAAFRGTIFEAISSAIERWVLIGLVALANSAWTFGASIAGWIVDVQIDAALLAARISAKIAQLVAKAGRIAQTLGRDGGKLDAIGTKLVDLSERMMHEARSARSYLGWDRRHLHDGTIGRGLHLGDRGALEAIEAEVGHLTDSAKRVKAILPAGVGQALDRGKDAAAIAVDPSTEHVDDAASHATKRAADERIEATKDAWKARDARRP